MQTTITTEARGAGWHWQATEGSTDRWASWFDAHEDTASAALQEQHDRLARLGFELASEDEWSEGYDHDTAKGLKLPVGWSRIYLRERVAVTV